MADRKYVRIPAKDLPDLFYIPNDVDAPEDGGNNVYFARYRVASEDGRLSSRWSQRFEIPTNIHAGDISLETTEWDAKITSDILSVTWNVNRIANPITDDQDPNFGKTFLFVNRFYVYARFKNNSVTGPWLFMQETTTTNYSTKMPDGTNRADVVVVVPTYRGLDATNTLEDSPANLFAESILFVAEDIN
jgi:hypothetical protein